MILTHPEVRLISDERSTSVHLPLILAANSGFFTGMQVRNPGVGDSGVSYEGFPLDESVP